MGISALMAYRGDPVLAEAAENAGIPIIMSGSALIRLEDVAAASPRSWFQAYLPVEPEKIDALIDRVARAGYETPVLTVDTAVLANRENQCPGGLLYAFAAQPTSCMARAQPSRVDDGNVYADDNKPWYSAFREFLRHPRCTNHSFECDARFWQERSLGLEPRH